MAQWFYCRPNKSMKFCKRQFNEKEIIIQSFRIVQNDQIEIPNKKKIQSNEVSTGRNIESNSNDSKECTLVKRGFGFEIITNENADKNEKLSKIKSITIRKRNSEIYNNDSIDAKKKIIFNYS